jgi:cell division protein FtsQ
VLFGGFGTIFAQNNSENNGIEIKVKHLSDANYVSSAEVEKMLRNKGLYSEKTLPSHINTSKINSVVEALAGVKSAKCYISKNNKLVVEITQCKPLFRVMKSNGRNFFVSEDGKIVEAGAGFFVDIPIVTTSTEVKIEFAKGELSEFVKFIENDDFLKNLVVQIVSERTKNGKDSITLIPRAGNQVIIVGELHDADNEPNFKAKLNRLKTFYEKQVLDVKGWNAYSKIDLRFKNKIYCTKKN